MSTVLSTDIIVPAIIVFVAAYSVLKRSDFFAAFLDGAKEGLRSAASVLPALCLLMTAVGMVRASGVLDLLAGFASPFLAKVGFPAEVLPLALLRPFSGSGALAYYGKLCESLSPDSFAARVASVLMGGSETTFYTIAVYYGGAGIKNGRNTVFAALAADLAAAVLSVLAVNLFMK